MSEAPFTPPEHPTDLFKLPSGDWIDICAVTAGRISEKANRQTGEVGANVFINADGSWYTIHFENRDDGAAFLDALIEHRNALRRPALRGRPLGRNEALGLIDDLRALGPAEAAHG